MRPRVPTSRATVVAPLTFVLLVGLVVGGCSDDGATDAPDGPDERAEDDDAATRAPRFCDVYLDYLAEATPANLDAIVTAADDDQVDELVAIIREDDRTGRVLAADSDLEALARTRCQAEWVGGAQGAGNTAGAAQAFFDAVVAGDQIGARNVASANAIARFEPWAPVVADPETGTPTLLTVDEQSFTMALDPDRIAECQVETGVIITCTVAE